MRCLIYYESFTSRIVNLIPDWLRLFELTAANMIDQEFGKKIFINTWTSLYLLEIKHVACIEPLHSCSMIFKF